MKRIGNSDFTSRVVEFGINGNTMGYNRDYGTINDYNRDINIVGYHQAFPKMVDFPPIAIDSHVFRS